MLILFFFSVLSVCFAAMMLLLRPARAAERVRMRLETLQRMQFERQGASPELEQSRDNWQTRTETWLLKTSSGQSLADLLMQSRSNRTITGFLEISFAIALATGFFTGLINGSVIAGLCGATLSACMYPVLLVFRRKRRTERFGSQLSATAAMMARALRAGHALPLVLELVADQAKDPLREDFAQLSRELRLGVPMRDALLSLSRRVPLPDLRFLVSAILIQKETGGDLIQVLERTSALIEDRLRIRRQVQTFTAQGRMSAWILTALPILLLLLLSAAMPGYASTLFHDAAGQHMLLAGGVLLLIGATVIRRIVNIKV